MTILGLRGRRTKLKFQLVRVKFLGKVWQKAVMFPYGFFADNSETEYDSFKKLDAASFPVSQYVRCINDSLPFGHWLADKVLDELQALNNLQKAFDSLEYKP